MNLKPIPGEPGVYEPTIEHIQPSEFEQIGQLLARCEEYSIMQHEDCKSASVRLKGQKRFSMGIGTTQLDAIRDAIEAAEQGVRE